MRDRRFKHMKARLGALAAGFFCTACYGLHAAFAAGGGGQHGAEPSGHGAQAGEHGGSSAGLPQLDVSTFPSQLFWLLVSFALLYAIFSKKTLPEISGVIENRQNYIEKDIASAEKMKSEAEEVQKAYEASLGKAREEATRVLADMQDEIRAKADQQSADFRGKAEAEIRALEKSLNKAKQGSMEEMHTIAAELATEAARKIVGIATDIEQAKTVIKAINGSNKAKAA